MGAFLGELAGGMTADPDPGFKVKFTAPGGESFLLAGAVGVGHRDQRVVLLEGGFVDGVAHPELEHLASPTGVGVRTAETFSLPKMDGGFSVLVAGEGYRAGEHFQEWRRAWTSTLPLIPGGAPRPGRILVDHRSGGNFWTRAVLREAAASPAREPAHVHHIQDSVEWYSPDGCWFGPRREYEAGLVRVVPGGDFSPHVELVWDGVPGTLMYPDGSTLTLASASGGPFVIDLDRGMYGYTTNFVTGKPETLVWSGLKGKVSGVSLVPHLSHNFVLPEGMKLVVVPRFYSPWR